MGNQIILHQTPLEDIRAFICDAVVEQFNKLQLSKPKEPKLYTRQEASKILGVTLPTLHNWTMNGKIQGARIGNSVRYREQDIEASLKDICVKSKRR